VVTKNSFRSIQLADEEGIGDSILENPWEVILERRHYLA
jgi:hypothetical protein